MNAEEPAVTVAAIGDIHVHESGGGMFRELFARISEEADVLALCGDLTNLGLPQEAEHLVEDLRACTVPVVAVLGNHDLHSNHADTIRRILYDAQIHYLEDETFEWKGVGFAGVKGFGGGFDNHMLSAFGEEATKHFVNETVSESLRLENALQSISAERIVVVLHYAPIAGTVSGEPPEIYPYLGCSRLMETIARYPGVKAVVHGHAHHGSYEGKSVTGIPVYNCAFEILRKRDGTRPYSLLSV